MSNVILSPLPAPGNAGTLLDHARAYAARGWSIIAVTAKKPAGMWRPFQEHPADKATLRKMFGKPGITGLAVITGAVSGGLAIRDYDDADAYRRWADANPDDAAKLPTVQTARGYHVYGTLDTEQYTKYTDGELRGDSGHITVLPPSRHPSGATYQWIIPLPDVWTPLPRLPASLVGAAPCGASQHGFPRDLPTNQTKQNMTCVSPAVFTAIMASLPDGPGRRNHQVFELVRRLKGIAGLDTSPAALKAIAHDWFQLALPKITTKDFNETWCDFQRAWIAAKKPHGNTIRAAYEAACKAPMNLDGNASVGILAATCRNLSGAGCKPFFLSCRTVSELFGIGIRQAWKLINAVRFYNLIEPITVGTLKGRRASEYRYVGDNGEVQQ